MSLTLIKWDVLKFASCTVYTRGFQTTHATISSKIDKIVDEDSVKYNKDKD